MNGFTPLLITCEWVHNLSKKVGVMRDDDENDDDDEDDDDEWQ